MTKGKIIALFLLICVVTTLAVDTANKSTAKEKKVPEKKKEPETRGKRNLNVFGNYQVADRRDYNYNAGSNYNNYPSFAGGHASDSANFVNAPSHHHRTQYLEAPEPIIEIIIKDSNESIPDAQPLIQTLPGKKKKEQVQVFYVKYQNDDKNGLVIHDPIPALSPAKYQQDEHDEEEDEHEHLTVVTPLPPAKTTTLRTIIRPESEQYEAQRGIHVTFGSEHNPHSKADFNVHEEKKEESAIQPVVAVPQNRVDIPNQLKQSQGRVINGFQQQLPHHSQPQNFNSPHPQNNFVAPPSFLSTQLTLPHQHGAKQFNQNPFSAPQPTQQSSIRPSQPLPPVQQQLPPHQNFGSRPQFVQQQFNQQQSPPRFAPQAQALIGAPPPNQQFNQNQQNNIPGIRPPNQNAPITFINNNFHQRPFNHHAHPTRIQQQQGPPTQNQQNQNFNSQNLQPQQSQHFNTQFQQLNQRPQKPIPIPLQNFNQQPPSTRTQPLFSSQFNQPQPLISQHPTRPQFSQFNSFQQQLPKQQVSQFRPPISQQLPLSQAPPRFNPHLPPTIQPLNSHVPPTQAQFHNHQQTQHHHHPSVAPTQSVPTTQSQQSTFNDLNVFRGGGLVEQNAPNLATAQPALQQQHSQNLQLHSQLQVAPQSSSSHINHNQNLQGIVPSNSELIQAVPKFEHHITETINSPILYNTHSINMDFTSSTTTSRPEHPHHRFAINGQSVSNHYSDVFPQIQQHQQQQQHQQNQQNQQNFQHNQQHHNHREEYRPQSLPQIDPRVNGNSNSQIIASTYRPTQSTTTIRYSSTTTPSPPTTTAPKKIPSNIVLPDEVPDDLRAQLLSSGILDNADISVLDYDKIGETSLDQLPPEHLANFFSAGGGSQIASSNKILKVVKPNGENVEERLKSLQADPEISKILENTKRLPSKKEDVNLKVVRFDADSEQSVSNQYIRQDSQVLPSVNINQNYNRYLPLKINGAQFPIPDVDELRGKKISSVVVLAPVDNVSGNSEETRVERDLIDTKQIQFVAGESLKQLLKKPSLDNYKKWLEKESKTEADQQSVILLVTRDNQDQQEIFMYDITTKSVNKLDGELSTKFVNVAEENSDIHEDLPPIVAKGTTAAPLIDRSDVDVTEDTEEVEDEDAQPAETNIVETIVKYDEHPGPREENKVLISSGYSVIKNE